jgi:hypothetical protein
LALDQFNLQILQRLVIELELPFEGPIGHAPPLAEQRDHLIHYCHKVHPVSSQSMVVPGSTRVLAS